MTEGSPATISRLPGAGAQPLANVIAVASGKGGVGKTWFSITLSHAMANLGQRTLLFDGDLGLANVDIQLGLMPNRDLTAVVEGTSTLKGAAQRFADGGFDIIAGRSGSGGLAGLSQQRLGDLRGAIADLSADYDRIVLDLGAGLERPIRMLAVQAGAILVVTTDEPTALTDAYAFIKTIRAARPAADLRVVVNMARTLREGQRTYETLLKACRNFLKFNPPLVGIIRQDRMVRDAIRSQTALLRRAPSSDAAKDVEKIAEGLLNAG